MEKLLQATEQFPISKVCFVPKHAACQQLLATARNKQPKKNLKIPNFNISCQHILHLTGKSKRESSALPDLPLPPVFAVLGVTFQEIFAAFMVSPHLKIQELHWFPSLLHWRPRELQFAQSCPDIWELPLPRSEDEMLVMKRWKFFCSSATPTVSFHCFCFIHLILERKNKGKKQTPKHKKPKTNKTTPQPPATSSHSNGALSLQVTEIQIC